MVPYAEKHFALCYSFWSLFLFGFHAGKRVNIWRESRRLTPQGHRYRAGPSLLLSCYYGTFIYYWEFTLGRDPPGEVLHTATDRKGSGLLRLVGGWDAILSPIRLLPEPSRWGRPSSELPANYSSHVLGHWCQARLGSQCEETFLPALVALDSLVPVNSGKDLCVCACTCVQHVRVCMRPYMCV